MNKTNMLKKILCFTIALLMLMPAMPGNLAMAVENPTVPGNIKIGGPVEPYNPDDYPIFPNQGYVRMEKYAEWIEKSEGTAKITFEITGQPVQQGVDAVLVIDRSGSMDDRTGGIGSPKRMDIAKESATNFVNTMLTPVDGSTSSENRVAVVSFAGGDYWETFFGIPIRYIPRDFTIESGVSEEKDALLGKINALRGNGNTGTNYEAAFEGAKAVLDARDDKTRPAYIIFLTDGEPNIGSDNPSDATLLKNAGVTIYAVSFQAGNNAYNIIKDVATSPSYAYNIANANDLSDLFTTLANNTKIAGTEAKLKDIIHSDYFDIDTTVLPNVIATAGIANVTGNIVDWDIENITANGAKLEIFIKLKPNLMGEEENSYPTNYSASLIYKNFNNVSCEQIVDSPELTIGAGKITIQYYLVNKDGEPINENRDVIPFDNFVPLGSEEYKITVGEGETTLLPSGTYNPISPATLPDNYVYVEASKEHGGNTSGADVVIDISSENQNDYIKTVYFGYCKGYTVTFVDHDGTILDTQTVVHGGAATEPTAPTRDGYTFTGWDKAFDNIIADTTVTAQYNQITHIVTFVDHDGTILDTQTVVHGGAATEPTAPTRDGYTFTGWDKAFDNIIADTTVTAQYNQITHTVTFVDYDETMLKTETVAHGGSATAPSNPTRAGYTFTGWDVPFDNITADTTVTAQYSQITYTVTFVDYDETTLKTETVAHGGSATAPSDPTRAGYTFTGWDVPFDNITADTTVTAQYVKDDIETINVSVYKIWLDENEEPYEGEVPDITIRLFNGLTQVGIVTLENGESEYTFMGLPLLDTNDVQIVYTVSEDPVSGYIPDYEPINEDFVITITNTKQAVEDDDIRESDIHEVYWNYETGYNTNDYNVRYSKTNGVGSLTEDKISDYVEDRYDRNYTYVNAKRTIDYEDVVIVDEIITNSTSGSGISAEVVTSSGIKAILNLFYDRNRPSTPSPRPTPPTIIEDPEIPLADLEKVDHFAYVIGYPDGEVKPMGKITREEVAMIFYRLLTDDSRNELLSDVNPFTDLAGHDWSNRAISTLYNAGIISGYPDGTFRPSAPITRAEFATIAAKFDELELQNTSKFTDIFGHWAEDYITSSENKGWIKGYPDLTFKPEQDITRAEAMTLINNVLERAVPAENIHPDAIFWPDMTSDDWYYEAVMEATNSHDYIYNEDGEELWTGMKANKVWP